jgi:hypothetical protein
VHPVRLQLASGRRSFPARPPWPGHQQVTQGDEDRDRVQRAHVVLDVVDELGVSSSGRAALDHSLAKSDRDNQIACFGTRAAIEMHRRHGRRAQGRRALDPGPPGPPWGSIEPVLDVAVC